LTVHHANVLLFSTVPTSHYATKKRAGTSTKWRIFVVESVRRG
jgi:hypothetical protein